MYLFDITNNQTYRDASESSLAFMKAHLYNQSNGHVLDAIDLSTCQNNKDIWTYEAGLYLEALSVLGHKTNDTAIIER